MEIQPSTFQKIKNPLRIIMNTTIVVFFLILILYVVLKLLLVYESDDRLKQGLMEIVSKIETISELGWDFVKPFLQLAIILLIVEWVLTKIGINFSQPNKLEWNIQTIIALLIVGAFTIAALGDIPGVGYLQDIALVVVGFYFGSQNKRDSNLIKAAGGAETKDNS